MRSLTSAALLLSLSACCNNSEFGTAEPKISITPGALSFSVYLGASGTQVVTVGNGGAAGDTVALTLDGGAGFSFSGPAQLEVGPGALLPVSVTFAPTDAGASQAMLSFVASAGALDVVLSGVALGPLTCAPLDPCDLATFDADGGQCIHATAADGTACPDPTLCLANPACQQGSCVGTPKDCDDQNACTLDYCVSGTGCQHQDTSASCQGSAPCQVYSCDPSSGCTQNNAPNGTLCSTDDNCQTAQVCILGNCSGVSVPDGTPCKLWWEPCVDAGCQGGVCHDAVAEAEVPGQLRWSVELEQAAGPLAVDDGGASYFLGTITSDGGTNGYHPALFAISACGQMLWTYSVYNANVIVDGDQLIVGRGDEVVSLDRSTGATLWTLSPVLQCGAYPCSLYQMALSSQGILYVLASGPEDEDSLPDAGFPDAGLAFDDGGTGPALMAVYANGQAAWWVPLPQNPQSVVADREGNAHLLLIDAGSGNSLLTFDPNGVLISKLDLPFPASNFSYALDVGSGFIFAEDFGAEIGFDGGIDFVSTGLGLFGVVIDTAGNVFATQDEQFEAIDPQGDVRWTFPQGLFHEAVLGSDGTVFGVSWLSGIGDALVALDGDAGTLLWSSLLSTSVSYDNQSTLALSPTASLLLSGFDDGSSQVLSFFAGQIGPSQTAPWGRAQGGNNASRFSPGP